MTSEMLLVNVEMNAAWTKIDGKGQSQFVFIPWYVTSKGMAASLSHKQPREMERELTALWV